MSRVLADGDLNRKLGHQGRELAVTAWSLDHAAERLVECLERVVQP